MILRYLKTAPGKGLLFSNHNHLNVKGYTDADWDTSPDDKRSTLGYCTFVRDNLVTWRSKKQLVVARSSAKAKYRAMALGVCELLWVNKVMEELGFPRKWPILLYSDSKVAISIAGNPVQHDRTKHIEID